METKEEILSILKVSDYPDRVPRFKGRGTPTQIFVKIFVKRPTAATSWYKNDEIYRVYNKLYWGFSSGGPHFVVQLDKQGNPEYGIALEHCDILAPGTPLEVKLPMPEYTLEDLEKKVGHKFTLKIDV